jgi:CubicO group peptidase (beta-lactamase class C family)
VSLTAEAFDALLRRTGGGASLVAYRGGERVVDLHGGSDSNGRPWTDRTLVQCQSTTKGVLATLLHVLASQGKLDLDAPVADYWPEFGKPAVTVTHVLSHAAGLHAIRARTKSLDEMYDWDHQVRALEQQSPSYEPGSRHGYHALTYGWLTGELAQRITGLDIRDAVRTYLAEPLGQPDLQIGCPPSEQARVATCRYRFAPMPGSCLPRGNRQLTTDPRAMTHPVPAISGFFTAEALAVMYAKLPVLLDPDVHRRAIEVQSTDRDGVLRIRMGWRLGYHGFAPHSVVYGHSGFGGSAAWADPEHDLAAAFTTDRSTRIPDDRVRKLIGALRKDLA